MYFELVENVIKNFAIFTTKLAKKLVQNTHLYQPKFVPYIYIYYIIY